MRQFFHTAHVYISIHLDISYHIPQIRKKTPRASAPRIRWNEKYRLLSLVPLFSVFPELSQGRLMHIDHMAGRVIGKLNAGLTVRIHENVVKAPFSVEKGRGHVRSIRTAPGF